jgi:uncharacterized sulfatase
MDQPDIFFIVLDTQRADRLGAYGYRGRRNGTSISPNLDAFAEQSVLFDQAIAPAQWTIPSHASMFTGLYPTAHQVVQSNRSLGPDRPHLAEVLLETGYRTFGFCNNPLVGVLDNGFKRGFETFYNYGGAFPSVPKHSTRLPWPANQLLEAYTQFLRRISYPIQNFFGQSDLAFRISLNAFLTPVWSKMANFKGQNERSVKDLVRFLEDWDKGQEKEPLFIFMNLMETHFPFWPPGEFVNQIAPYMLRDRKARDIMRSWNREAYRWSAPIERPLPEFEDRVLNDMYDAEVRYQDDYLGQFFDALDRRKKAKNTLTIIVSDHGDGLGEHNRFGHAFVAYQELVRVPMMMRWPDRLSNTDRQYAPVSTRRIYHTILEAAGPLPQVDLNLDPAEVHGLTLLASQTGPDPEHGLAFSEIYPPLNYAKAIRQRHPELLELYRCLSMRRTVLSDKMKLIQVGDQPDELFDISEDPLELNNIINDQPQEAARLNHEIIQLTHLAEAQRDNLAHGRRINLGVDEQLLNHLRGLGYIE